MNDYKKQRGYEIRATRVQQGYSLRQLSKLAGISTKTLLRLEHGEGNFREDTIQKVLTALNIKKTVNFASNSLSVGTSV